MAPDESRQCDAQAQAAGTHRAHLEGEPAEKYLAALPALIEATKQQDTTCGALWGEQQADHATQNYHAEQDRLVTLLVSFDFSLRNYEKLAPEPKKMLAEMVAGPQSDADTLVAGSAGDDPSARMTEQEYAELEREIEKDLQTVDQAHHELIAAHDGLVAKWAEKSPEAVDEATSYARSGLAKAAENFDVRRGHRFAAYAQWWIKTAIKEKKSWEA